MKAYVAEADWAPKEGYVLTEREKRDKRALLGNLVWKNVRASLKEVPEPKMGREDVIIKIGACGICGSDLHATEMDEENYSLFASHTRFPVILGHEFSGEIVEVGSDVTEVKVGDLIAVEQIRWCGKCYSCRIGMFNQCKNLEEIGLTADGGFAEYAVVPQKFCCNINNIAELLGSKIAALEAGALTEPTAVAYSGMFINGGGFKPGAHVVVFGAGPIGLAATALARAAGAAKVIVIDIVDYRLNLAKDMGATDLLNPIELGKQGLTPGDAVMQLTNGIGGGMVVEAAGNSAKTYPEIEKCIAIGAKVISLGMEARKASIQMINFQRTNSRIQGSLGQAGSDIFPSVLRLMAAGRIDMRKMVTGRFSLDNIEKALEDMHKNPNAKVLVGQHY
ncbi:MAG: scyllo-inosose 3-dehydrogenase [Christensenellales bacterium]|jgi:threonine dehydrogenase-like Zn-dependent dehydrogenase